MSSRYDVALSFAASDREVASTLAAALSSEGLNVFFDELSSSELWGKDLYSHLSNIYSSARVCVVLLSESYTKSKWTASEYRSLLAQSNSKDYFAILPIKLDKSTLPSGMDTVGYISLEDISPKKAAALVKQKLSLLSEPKKKATSRYHVSRRDSQWVVRKTGASRASSIHKTQIEAIEKAKKIASRHKQNQVVIHNADGSIKEKLFVGGNND